MLAALVLRTLEPCLQYSDQVWGGGGCRCGCYSGSMMGVCVLLFFLSNFECFCVGNIIEQEI